MTVLTLKLSFEVAGHHVRSEAARQGGGEVTGITVNQLSRVLHRLSSLTGLIWVIDCDVALQVLPGREMFPAVGTHPGEILPDKSLTFPGVFCGLIRGAVEGADVFPDVQFAGHHVVAHQAGVLQAHVGLLQVGVVQGQALTGLAAKPALVSNLFCLLS